MDSILNNCLQTDVSSLLSQLKDLQKKNTDLEEENKKITLKVNFEITIIYLHQKTNAYADIYIYICLVCSFKQWKLITVQCKNS